MLWSFPCSSGDFRLIPDGEICCKLEIEKPTDNDREVLGKLLTVAREKKWVGPDVGLPNGKKRGRKAKHIIAIDAPMSEVGPILSDQLHGDAETWTAIRFESGKVTLEAGSVSMEADDDAEDKPQVAATVRQPKTGCPAPEPAERRASEVLAAFSTRSQWDQWLRDGFMDLVGPTSGRLYRLWCHKEAVARGMGHLLVDVESGHEVCVYDPGVPPPEEALAIKLAVEHKEGWLLERSSNLLGVGYGDLRPSASQIRARVRHGNADPIFD